MSFITAQRERLSILISALDKEANTLQSSEAGKAAGLRAVSSMNSNGNGGNEEDEGRPKIAVSRLSKSRSEVDFEKIDAESGTEEVEMVRKQARRTQSGSWLPWSWGAKPAEELDTTMTGERSGEGKSTGIEL
jgi:hypothetical protein